MCMKMAKYNSSSETKEKNYITPDGLRKLQDEYQHLKYKERPIVTQAVQVAAENGDRSENGDYIYGKKRLREIDRRLGFLAKRIESAEVIDPEKLSGKVVRFGATVTIIDENDNERTYSVVGVDELDPNAGRISWICPLARALLNKQEGDFVSFDSPKGRQDIEIARVEYKAVK